MWFVTKLALAGGMAFFVLQSSTRPAGEQNSSCLKVATATHQKAKESAELSSTVGPTQPVITVRGLCGEGAGKAADNAGSCSQVISREQFETLMDALNPGSQQISPAARQNLAKTYAELLAVEAAAKNAGIEDTPQFQALIKWVRLRTIADLYRRQLQEKYRNPSQEEIGAYYKQHVAEFERVSLVRILVPRENVSAPDKNEYDRKALEAAKAARERASKGEDPAQIQKDAYTALGLNAPPTTDLGNRRRADLVANEAADVFSLKAGEVSQVEVETKSYVIYKVLGKDAMSEEEAKTEIAREVYQQKFKDAMKSVIDAAPAELNPRYFGPGTPPSPASGQNLPAQPKGH